jgi:hypothetical protein
MGPEGFEPTSEIPSYGPKAKISKRGDAKSDAHNAPNSVLSTCLDNLVQLYPDLAQLVKVWPEMPKYIKAAIKALVQTHTKGVE